MHCSKKFWLENIANLFCSFDIIPMRDMVVEEQMNCLTRVVFLIFLLLFIIDYRYDFLFFGVSLIVIIIIYYVLKAVGHKTCKEGYGLVDTVIEPVKPVPWLTGTNNFVFANGTTNTSGCSKIRRPIDLLELNVDNSNPGLINTSDSLRWCTEEVPLQETVGLNQRLIGPPNPKTLVQPVIASPAYDFQSWAPNDFVVPSFLNDQRRQELYQNGYTDTINANAFANTMEPYDGGYYKSDPPIIENYDYLNTGYPSVDTACGYNPSNVQYNLPVNYNASVCQKTPQMASYNRNLRTIPLQPGLNTFSEVNQPYASMSNLGISMTQPFLPTTFSNPPTSNGQGSYVEHDPSMYYSDQSMQPIQNPVNPLRNEIYDPRYNGYGPNYRNYIEPVTGQPRFYYDDIDSQKQYNYICRSKIGFTPFGPQTGPISLNNETLSNMEIRDLANQTYVDSVIQQRTELQQRLMHKNSNREWQQRQMPLNRQNFARAGGGKSNTNGGYAGPRG